MMKDEVLTLADVVDPRTEKVLPQDCPDLPFVGLDDIEAQTMRLLRVKSSSELRSSAKRFYKGDVLYSRLRPYLNKVWCADRDGICSSEIIVLPGNSHISAKFLAYRLNAADFVSFANSLNAGDRPRVDFDQISSFILPPFSLGRQLRIVAKIEELFSELDNGIAALKTAREQLKIYRQAVLKHAFEGKLTATWREENADKLEPPEQLLARIQQEREARYQQQLAEWKVAVKEWEAKGKEGKKPGKPGKPKKLVAVAHPDFDIPERWAAATLDGVAYESVLGKMLDKQKNIGDERPYLGNINVRWGQFAVDGLKTMKIEDSEVSRYSLQHNDLVVCEGGEPGRCAVWQGEDNRIFIQKALHRIRFTSSYSPRFAFYYLTYAVPLERVIKHFTGTTIKHLTGAGLSKVQLPICSISEQNEILKIIETKLSEIEKLDSELDTQLAKAETLRQSILKKAFSGQLVPQDPNDEPASALLERIKAEKAAVQARAKPAAGQRGRKKKEVCQ